MLLLESAAQVGEAFSTRLLREPGTVALALSADALHELERRGIEHVTDDDLVDDRPFQALTATTAMRAQALADRLDEAAGLGERRVWRALTPELKRLLDALVGRAVLLDAMIERLGATAIARFDSGPFEPSPALELHGSSIWESVATSVARARDIAEETCPGPSLVAVYDPDGWERRCHSRIHRTRAALLAAVAFRRQARRLSAQGPAVLMISLTTEVGVEALRAATRGRRAILWSGRGMAVGMLTPLPALRPPRPDPRRRDSAEAAAVRAREVLTSPVAVEALAAAATEGPLDLSAPLSSELHRFASAGLKEVALVSPRATAALERWRVEHVLTTGTSYWWERAVKRAARAANIPVSSFQHGGGPGYLSDAGVSARLEEDLGDIDEYVGWGPGLEPGYCAASPWQPRFRVEPPGMLRELRTLRTRRTLAKPLTVLFAPTNLTGNWRTGPQTSMPDITSYRMMRVVVEAALANTSVRLVVKLSANEHSRNPLAEWAAGLGAGKRLEVRREPTYLDLLDDADVTIVGWPFTALLQALATDLPVLCAIDERSVTLRPDALELLRRRATVATDVRREPLRQAIAGFLVTARLPRWPVDDSFLEAYGLSS